MKRPGKVARYKIQRRLGTELPGLGKAGALERRPYPPGENGNKRKKYSDFALRLEEKQKLRFHYGLKEEQLRRFIHDAKRGAGSNWVSKLVGRLETRLDNIVFRLGLAPSIRSARQLISHGHILVNDKKMDISSYVVPTSSTVKIAEKSKENQIVLQAQASPRLDTPEFLQKNELGGTLQAVPGVEALSLIHI